METPPQNQLGAGPGRLRCLVMRWLDLANMPTNNPGTGMPLPKWEISKMEMKEGDTLVVRLPCMMRAADIDEMRDGIRRIIGADRKVMIVMPGVDLSILSHNAHVEARRDGCPHQQDGL